MKRVIIDTDGGADDAMALLLALRSPELCVEAITTVCGNVAVEQATSNVLRTLRLLGEGPHPPVAQGAGAPLVQPLRTAQEVHGRDGLGNATLRRGADGEPLYPPLRRPLLKQRGDELILHLVRANPGEISLITLGPLTNLAHAAERDAGGMRQAKDLFIMGGAFETYGNVTLTAEFNMRVDPEAARTVLELGIPTTFVPLDVTNRVVLTPAMLEPYLGVAAGSEAAGGRGGALAAFVREITGVVMAYEAERHGQPGCTMHDPLAVAVACVPELARAVETRVLVETKGEYTAGQTIADLRPRRASPANAAAPARVCVEVDAARFFAMFEERVLKG